MFYSNLVPFLSKIPFPIYPTSLTPLSSLLSDLVLHPFHFLSKKQQKHYHFDLTSLPFTGYFLSLSLSLCLVSFLKTLTKLPLNITPRFTDLVLF